MMDELQLKVEDEVNHSAAGPDEPVEYNKYNIV